MIWHEKHGRSWYLSVISTKSLSFCPSSVGFSVGGRGVKTSGHCSICSTGGDGVKLGVEVRCCFGTRGLKFERALCVFFPDSFIEFAYLEIQETQVHRDHKSRSYKANWATLYGTAEAPNWTPVPPRGKRSIYKTRWM